VKSYFGKIVFLAILAILAIVASISCNTVSKVNRDLDQLYETGTNINNFVKNVLPPAVEIANERQEQLSKTLEVLSVAFAETKVVMESIQTFLHQLLRIFWIIVVFIVANFVYSGWLHWRYHKKENKTC